MPQTAPLTSAQVRELGAQLAQLLAGAGVAVETTDVQTALPAMLGKLNVALVRHTCHPSGRSPFGKLAPAGVCERCDERRAEKAQGIAARPAPAWTQRSRAHQEDTGGYPSTARINDHFRPGGPHATGACGPVCTFGES